MNDPKQNIDSDILDLDNIVDDSVADIELQDGFDDVPTDDFGDLGADEDLTPVASGGTGSGRLWITLAILGFVLAIISSLVLQPAISVQKQRAGQASQVLAQVQLTNNAASQALTATGSYAPVIANIQAAENALDNLTGGGSISGSIASMIFNNGAADQQVQAGFDAYKSSVDKFLSNEAGVTELKGKLAELTEKVGVTVGESVGFVEAVAKEGRNKGTGTSKDKYLFLTSEASNLNGILGRLSTSVRGYFAPGTNLDQIANVQNGYMVRLQDTLKRIISNSAAVVGTAAQPLQAQYSDLSGRVSEIGERASALTDTRQALAGLLNQGGEFAGVVQQATGQTAALRFVQNLATVLPIILALLAAFALWKYMRTQRRGLVDHDADLEETLADQQESILKLLDEMSALADGDLTVEAEVTDQITGAIADSVNFAVMEMRELVSQINRASIEVANESELAVTNAQSVSKSNMAQADQISSAAALMQRVSSSMREMSEQANSSSAMATESITVAAQGTQAVRDTIKGMEDMREQIQDTSKRIKRLGESSQRIGDIVALIDDIAEQTNILSLNAAIQASMAGEAGRGFAVVSDEVQSLAERSTEATKKIAELVTTIQNDTNDAVLSMEKATQQVVSGTKVADSAGAALSEIENVSQRLSGLVQLISKGSNEQAEVVTKVSEQVTEVSDSSTDTSRKAQDSANSIAKLLELAKDLETSVSRFKLPAS